MTLAAGCGGEVVTQQIQQRRRARREIGPAQAQAGQRGQQQRG
ncbi:MAG TPA: hypothetical protein VGB85_20130 [Nannocystis sp.]